MADRSRVGAGVAVALAMLLLASGCGMARLGKELKAVERKLR